MSENGSNVTTEQRNSRKVRIGYVVSDKMEKTIVVELEDRVRAAARAGISPDRVILDPGIGFGKRGDQNWQALRGLERVVAIGPRVLVGTSRKKFLGELLAAGGADDEARRDLATAVTSVLAARAGAWAVRVHDVKASRDAVRVAQAWKAGHA